uniref:Uncharacterized protein n=1 Tax=Chromera velia CCMP2878 TaxID=1169474 RepID=A0A0G4H5T2_9ALVE|eukprot:Cvel_24795.t1-p1 / transcript=Cvel_24795.t1 / gene=Cvel_24795 / organism=Chromera_velia_CCMP2878 / gene_product=hypothetical protein / transcript_product=hypothetical protein / location=Cvel_scaffold2730:13389-14093(-) / protein_length=235 / sequence_SO=supercontig / SO=protein_coding / is_pseudo=false
MPRLFPNSPDLSLPACLVATLSQVTVSTPYFSNEQVGRFPAARSIVDFTFTDGASKRPFAFHLLHDADLYPPNIEEEDGEDDEYYWLFLRVWDCSDCSTERKDAAIKADKTFLRVQQERDPQPPQQAAALSAVRFKVELWNWSSTRWESNDITRWRKTAANGGIEENSVSNSRLRSCEKQERESHHYTELPLTDGVKNGVLSGPFLVCRVEVLKYLDWVPASRKQKEMERGNLMN